MRTILATDGSDFALLTEALLGKLPRQVLGDVLVVSVVAPVIMPTVGIEPLGGPAVSADIEPIIEAQVKAAQTAIDESVGRLAAKGIESRGQMLEGDPVEAMIDFIGEVGAGLVVVGSQGLGGIKGFLLGSVAQGLVSKAPCSVLIGHTYRGIDAAQSASKVEGRAKLSVGVGYDGTDGAHKAIEWVKSFGAGAFASIYAICAEPLAVVPSGIDPTAIVAATPEEHERVLEVVRRAEAELEGLADRVSGGTGIGSPCHVITEFAAAKDLDLLVVGATRHGFLETVLLGSVSKDLVKRSPCPACVVRAARP